LVRKNEDKSLKRCHFTIQFIYLIFSLSLVRAVAVSNVNAQLFVWDDGCKSITGLGRM